MKATLEGLSCDPHRWPDDISVSSSPELTQVIIVSPRLKHYPHIYISTIFAFSTGALLIMCAVLRNFFSILWVLAQLF